MSVLSIHQLNVSYQTLHVIKDMELSINEGEIVALFGPSGCGKTTVLKSVAGLLEQAQGKITIADRDVLSNTVCVPTEKRKVGLIFQDYALFPHLTIAENIAFGLTHLSKQQVSQKVTEMLELVKMAEYIDAYPSQLSGGQQQRIAIVRALACEPDILLFDEAFSNIDPQFRFELIADIRLLLKQQNIAAMFVTHNQDEAFAFCDRIAVMSEGKIEQLDSAERLFSAPATRFVAEFLGEGIWQQAHIQTSSRLMTEFGEISYVGIQDLSERVGQQVDIYLRPHQLSLTASDQSDIEVQQERFVGDGYQSQLELPQGLVHVKSAQSFLGQSVHIQATGALEKVFLD